MRSTFHFGKQGSTPVFSALRFFLGVVMCLGFLCIASSSAWADADSRAQDLCNNMNSGMTRHEVGVGVKIMKTWDDALKAESGTSKTPDYHGKLKDKQCLDYVITFYDSILELLSGIDVILTAIKAFISSLLDKLCDYAATAINNLLASVCIPLSMPNFSLPSLSSLSSTTCDGISLLNVIKFTSNGTGGSSSSGGGLLPLDPPTVYGYPSVRGTTTTSTTTSTTE